MTSDEHRILAAKWAHKSSNGDPMDRTLCYLRAMMHAAAASSAFIGAARDGAPELNGQHD